MFTLLHVKVGSAVRCPPFVQSSRFSCFFTPAVALQSRALCSIFLRDRVCFSFGKTQELFNVGNAELHTFFEGISGRGINYY